MIQEPFFWAYLGLSTVLFWSIPASYRLSALALISIVFIGAYDVVSLACLSLASASLYYCLPVIARRDRMALLFLLSGIVLLVGPLVALKLLRSTPELAGGLVSWVVPLGMSYYAFRLIHLMIESYRSGRYPDKAADYFSYVFMFTIFVAGPIQRYEPYHADREMVFRKDLLMDGIMRIVTGLLKQGVLYYALVEWRTDIIGERELTSLDGQTLWLYLFIAYIASYINLSAYTDIAIGASRLFGFRIMENFAFPVFATSIDDFWRRWHISLSSWCQSYVYSPVLGAMRSPYIAIVASFQVMGLWHAITMNRIAWGLFQAAGLILAVAVRRWKRGRKMGSGASFFGSAVGWISTQLFITMSFVFVVNENSNDILSSIRLMLRMLNIGGSQ